MTIDEDRAWKLREMLEPQRGIAERRMYGGLCFLLNGNVVCGLTPEAGMFSVGESHAPEACTVDGVRTMDLMGRSLRGIVEVDPALIDNPEASAWLMSLALSHARAQPHRPA